MTLKSIKAIVIAICTLGISLIVMRYGASKKEDGVKQEQLKQRQTDIKILDKKLKREEQHAHIEINNSGLNRDELTDSVWTKPDDSTTDEA